MRKLNKFLLGLLIGVSILSAVVPCFASGKDAYTKVLLHANGADASTKFYDSGNYLEGDTDKTVAFLHFDGADAATSTTNAGTDTGAITFVGTAQIDTAQSKFGGSSLLLDGNSDYLTIPDSDSWNFGSGDFTIDLWIRFNAVPGDAEQQTIISQAVDSSNRWLLSVRGQNEGAGGKDITFYAMGGGGTGANIAGLWTPSTNTWYHIAIVKSSGSSKIYIDGSSISLSATTEGSLPELNHTLDIGSYDGGARGRFVNGWLDDVRIVKGKALWTANFTAPTVSPSPKDVTAVGTAQIDTAQKEFGTGSLLLDGNSDYLTLVDSDDWNFGSGDFTIDCWVRFASVASGDFISQKIDSFNYQAFAYLSGIGLIYSRYYGGADKGTFYTAWTPSVNTWYHVAVVRNGSTTYLFIDGVSKSVTEQGSWAAMTDLDTLLDVGGGYYGYFNGWIDEFRISKGIARWTSNFTPPTREYTASDYSGQAIVITQ